MIHLFSWLTFKVCLLLKCAYWVFTVSNLLYFVTLQGDRWSSVQRSGPCRVIRCIPRFLSNHDGRLTKIHTHWRLCWTWGNFLSALLILSLEDGFWNGYNTLMKTIAFNSSFAKGPKFGAHIQKFKKKKTLHKLVLVVGFYPRDHPIFTTDF